MLNTKLALTSMGELEGMHKCLGYRSDKQVSH